MGTATRLVSALLRAFRPSTASRPAPRAPRQSPGAQGIATVEVAPPQRMTLSYAPNRDGAPDGGEIVWTWVPYEERDGRGKDRPVLIIGRADATRSYAVRLTSKPHAGDRDYLALGAGEWDPQGRPSWVDIEQLYLVHDAGMRREAAALDRRRFDAVASALSARYGWRVG
ncbi:type II toxin-antitoxin system PemK/MazF family toxin [Microbacterium mcarthurae (nom. nud.)]|uniref:Type II toxin-antitoxin system PemK/MazF family toxin n=1 Tax=Microbacterium mcarthurae TaxID=3035918 RepID=A0ABW9GBR2_9MICO